MQNLFRIKYYLLISCLIIIQGCTKSSDNKVDVTLFSSNKNIESKVDIISEGVSKQYVQISIINNGTKIAHLDSIKVIVSLPKNIKESNRVMYGGTCMGRTPIHQTVAKDPKSKSDTFQLIELNNNSYAFAGILSWNTFLPYIQYDHKEGIVITANGEGKPIQPGETIKFEKLLLDTNYSWQDLMFDYGKEIAKEQHIDTKEPLNLKGWSTWDYYGRVFDTKDVFKNIDQLVKDNKKANIIQIDGGWWTARGDYLSVRKNLQGGMKAIAKYAKSKGFKAGIHLDGFRADKNSELYRNHPDWFLKDQNGQTICQSIDKGDTFMQYIYYDYSNPEVCEYMKNVMKTIRTDWGFSYFKIDFIRYGLLQSIIEEHGKKAEDLSNVVTKVVAYNNNMTSVERTRAGLKAIREGIDDGFFLACSSIFGPTLGIVDGLRTGQDINPTYDFFKSSVLQNAGNFYLNGVVTINDADYLVLRNKEDEEPERAWGQYKFGGNTTYDEAKMWSDYIALYSNMKINSDNLLTLRKERKELINNAFSFKTARRFIPIDFWNHAKDRNDSYNVLLAENEDGVFLSLFNWDNSDRQFVIEGIGKTRVIDTKTKRKDEVLYGKLKINLKKHSSSILKLEGKDFTTLSKEIKTTIN